MKFKFIFFFQILDLRNNNLMQINDSVSQMLKNSTTLKQLWISGNPIACDCDNQPFLAFLQSNFKKVTQTTTTLPEISLKTNIVHYTKMVEHCVFLK